MSRPSHHDEHRQFERATKRNSRPRTKNRPEYAAAEIGFVTGVDRGRYTVWVSSRSSTDGDDADIPVFWLDLAKPEAVLNEFTSAIPYKYHHTAKVNWIVQVCDINDPDEIEPFYCRIVKRYGTPRGSFAVYRKIDGGADSFAKAADSASGARVLQAIKARELNRDRIVVGDRVLLVGDTSGAEDALARIVRIVDRTSVLRRTADDNDPFERVIVANADQLMVVVALADPPPRIGMIDRAVVAAYEAGIDATLVLTKADLGSPEELKSLYESAGVRVIVTRPLARTDSSPSGDSATANVALAQNDVAGALTPNRHSAGLEEAAQNPYHRQEMDAAGTLALDPESVEDVLAALRGRVTVFLGHSGVGKSTLVNALVPGAARATGIVNETTGRGRQTSTSAVALPLPTGDGWVIDTPGIRSLGIAHVQTEQVVAAFPDLIIVADNQCPRGCSHLADAPDCALDDWVESDPDPEVIAARRVRLESLRRLLTARAAAAISLEHHASKVERRSAASPKRKK